MRPNFHQSTCNCSASKIKPFSPPRPAPAIVPGGEKGELGGGDMSDEANTGRSEIIGYSLTYLKKLVRFKCIKQGLLFWGGKHNYNDIQGII